MNKWKHTTISNISKKITSGGTPSKKINEYYTGSIPWLNTKEVDFCRIFKTEFTISEEGLKKSSAKWIPKDSIIIAMYGATAGKVAINKIPLTTNQACCNLIIDSSLADYKFVYFFIKNSYQELINLASGAAQQNLSLRVLSSFPILLPPLAEQKAIAAVLGSLDDKIDLLHRQNATLERMAETLFRQWFIEEAQEGWEEKTLGDVVEICGGSTPSTKEPDFWNGNIFWTSPRDLADLKSPFLFSTERKISEKGLAKISSGLLPKGTLLLSSRAPIGYLAISEIEVAINQGYIAILNNDTIPNYFMFLWCKYNMEEIKAAGNGSVFQEISKSVFRTLSFTCPPLDLVKKFCHMIEPLFQKICFNQQQIRTLEKLRDTLLPKLMSGEVRVRVAE